MESLAVLPIPGNPGPSGPAIAYPPPHDQDQAARTLAAGLPARGSAQGLVELQETSATREPRQGEITFVPKAKRLPRMRSGVREAAKLAEAQAHRPGFRPWVAWLLTLTYAQPDAWQPRHLSRARMAMQAWAARRGFRLLVIWVAEMQERRARERGEHAIHYHAIVWCPRGVTPPKPDKQGWWPHGHTQRVKARNAVAYLMKYASKGTETPLPKGARIHGHCGLDPSRRAAYTHVRRPRWVRDLVPCGVRLRRIVRGGLFRLDTGERLISPWVAWYAGGLVHLRRRSDGDGITDGRIPS